MQIWQYNVCYINIIVMNNLIIKEKAREKKELSEGIVDITAPAKVT